MGCPRTTFFCLALLLRTCLLTVASDEVTSLLKFKQSLSNGDAALSSWNASSSPPCSDNKSKWKGLLCFNGSVFGLRLDAMGLGGTIDMEALSELPNLRTISFMSNSFRGRLPEVKKMGDALRGLFLSYNGFSGEMDEDFFGGLNKLKKVYLAHNEFSGKIPTSLAKLPRLVDVFLNDNGFEDGIPDFQSKKLRTVNLANNKLRGRIPASLRDQDPGSFSGNNGLCGKPLARCKWSVRKIVITVVVVVLGVVALAAIIILACFIINRRRQQQSSEKLKKIKEEFGNYKQQSSKTKKEQQLVEGQDVTNNKISSKGQEHGKLYFVRDDRERFELQQLLRASAEVLGSGSFGSSYKAMLLGGPTMVVKRFRQMSTVGKEEFHEHMTRLGRLSHPNLLPLVAFYYKKNERLLVTDFVENGSLASLLHGKRSPNQPGLDWPTRLKIIKGIGRGLIYLYKELPSLTLPHGHLKSTNVLLDTTFEPLLVDYALIPAINKNHARQFMVAFKSPELAQRRDGRATRKTDVWSLGILILEVLTGKFPANYLKQGRGTNDDLAAWVSSVVREEWTGEVFDKEMKGTKNGEGEMLKLLKIGMCCCEWDAEKRWDVWEAVEKIEGMRERDVDEDEENYSSYASEHGEIHTSRAVNDDDLSFPMQ